MDGDPTPAQRRRGDANAVAAATVAAGGEPGSPLRNQRLSYGADGSAVGGRKKRGPPPRRAVASDADRSPASSPVKKAGRGTAGRGGRGGRSKRGCRVGARAFNPQRSDDGPSPPSVAHPLDPPTATSVATPASAAKQKQKTSAPKQKTAAPKNTVKDNIRRSPR